MDGRISICPNDVASVVLTCDMANTSMSDSDAAIMVCVHVVLVK